MSESLSPEVENLVLPYIDGKRFASANDVILAAMRFFNWFQSQYREQTGSAIRQGFEQIDQGKCIAMQDESAIHDFFDDIKRRGRQRVSRQD